MKLPKLLLALTLSVGLAHAASAKSIDLGTLGNDDFNFSGNLIAPHSSFMDTISFSLTSASSITDWFLSSGLSSWKVELATPSTVQWFNSTSGDFFSFAHNTFSSLAAGDYTMTLTGTTGNRRGLYLNAFNVTAVPEADTWVMLIIGGVLVGLRLRRKQQMLPSRAIIAG